MIAFSDSSGGSSRQLRSLLPPICHGHPRGIEATLLKLSREVQPGPLTGYRMVLDGVTEGKLTLPVFVDPVPRYEYSQEDETILDPDEDSTSARVFDRDGDE